MVNGDDQSVSLKVRCFQGCLGLPILLYFLCINKSGMTLGWPKSSFRCYRKTQMNLLANPIKICLKSKRVLSVTIKQKF